MAAHDPGQDAPGGFELNAHLPGLAPEEIAALRDHDPAELPADALNALLDDDLAEIEAQEQRQAEARRIEEQQRAAAEAQRQAERAERRAQMARYRNALEVHEMRWDELRRRSEMLPEGTEIGEPDHPYFGAMMFGGQPLWKAEWVDLDWSMWSPDYVGTFNLDPFTTDLYVYLEMDYHNPYLFNENIPLTDAQSDLLSQILSEWNPPHFQVRYGYYI